MPRGKADEPARNLLADGETEEALSLPHAEIRRRLHEQDAAVGKDPIREEEMRTLRVEGVIFDATHGKPKGCA